MAIKSLVKDIELVERRRKQIIESAITLFKDKGFHRTTTREIAKESGFSIGTLYEYVRTKEDVLSLVYEAINDRVYNHLKDSLQLKEVTLENLYRAIDSYYRLIDAMQEEVVILYQEVKSLDPQSRESILEKERQMVLILKNALLLCLPKDYNQQRAELLGKHKSRALLLCLPKDYNQQRAELLANNIFVQGQMWGFRRWILSKKYSLDDYITYQINFLKCAL